MSMSLDLRSFKFGWLVTPQIRPTWVVCMYVYHFEPKCSDNVNRQNELRLQRYQ